MRGFWTLLTSPAQRRRRVPAGHRHQVRRRQNRLKWRCFIPALTIDFAAAKTDGYFTAIVTLACLAAVPTVRPGFLWSPRSPALGHRIDGWRVCWLGGWNRCHVFFVVMVERQKPTGRLGRSRPKLSVKKHHRYPVLGWLTGNA
jgi:hypothetical protein